MEWISWWKVRCFKRVLQFLYLCGLCLTTLLCVLVLMTPTVILLFGSAFVSCLALYLKLILWPFMWTYETHSPERRRKNKNQWTVWRSSTNSSPWIYSDSDTTITYRVSVNYHFSYYENSKFNCKGIKLKNNFWKFNNMKGKDHKVETLINCIF
jgi:hypothetical protein